ncbi:DUF3108 domain-containing protein [Steroidobacter denitrificans]|nr:DUF3108 domain-containing protein [Steroidobacter denitrificans]
MSPRLAAKSFVPHPARRSASELVVALLAGVAACILPAVHAHAAAREAPGHETPGHEIPGHEIPGSETPGHKIPGHEVPHPASAQDAVENGVRTAVPRAFAATYTVTYRGLGAGTITFTFAQDAAGGHYHFETRPHPSALARLFVSRRAVERSVMQIDSQGVRPLLWTLDDGTSGNKDGELHFDWIDRRVSGEVEAEPVDLPIETGLQDRSSLQIAVSTALLRGRQPGTIPLVDDNRIKHYSYVLQGQERRSTKIGTLDTLMYESSRPGSSRVSRLWLAPKFDFLPVRVEQIRKGRTETVMELLSLSQ